MYFEKLKGELYIGLGFVLLIGQFTVFPEVETVLSQMRDCGAYFQLLDNSSTFYRLALMETVA